MTDDEIAALRASAEKAADAEEDWYGAEYLEGALHRPPQDIDATYIAAASPAAVLALLDEREALRAALQALVRAADGVKVAYTVEASAYAADDLDAAANAARAALAGSAAP